MKVQLISDVHLEFMMPAMQHAVLGSIFKGEANTLVLAGDIFPLRIIDTVRDALNFICEKYENVLYVPGNHEFYGTSPGFGETNLGAVCNEISNFHWLRSASKPLKIGNKTFWGDTMWFPDGPSNKMLEDQLNDFRHIHAFTPWCYRQNMAFRQAYQNVQADVVITHHLPSYKSVPARYRSDVVGNDLNVFFVSDMEREMNIWQPKFWFHGHTHDPCDYTLGDTRVICNPLGYPGEFDRKYKNRVIDI